MSEYEAQDWTVLKVGLWNGAMTGARGRLLYRTILRSAMDRGIRGGTAWVGIEGGHGRGAFRTVESEVASNELPVNLAFIDHAAPLAAWLPDLRRLVGQNGVVTSDEASVWLHAARAEGRMGSGGSAGSGAEDGGRVSQKPADVRGGDGRRDGPQGDGRTRADAENPTRGSPLDEAAAEGLMVQVYTVESRMLHGKPVYQAVAEFLRRRGALWVSTTRGLTGFGQERRVHEPQWLLRGNDAPVMITVLDRRDRLEPYLQELVRFVGHEGLVVSRPVRWHHP
ncbi:DUF190 domain-containing protein [Alicyclobacillus sp.]|uniref:DUF190 domain-containing protein n=1 Tax=Alicyclobacillus sp. TaxID=61169 RepID=UPI0025BDE758|nr:DUF190 domain-containing protein [Alicyclobacillus sp.]MCL6517173.1 DUF190 domain-containing protein [Alicyclobacillus sp.]